MTKIYINKQILNALNKISDAGHRAALEEGGGGNSYTNTYITIRIIRDGTDKQLIIKHVSGYGNQFSEFWGVSEEFGDLKYKSSGIAELISAAEQLAKN